MRPRAAGRGPRQSSRGRLPPDASPGAPAASAQPEAWRRVGGREASRPVRPLLTRGCSAAREGWGARGGVGRGAAGARGAASRERRTPRTRTVRRVGRPCGAEAPVFVGESCGGAGRRGVRERVSESESAEVMRGRSIYGGGARCCGGRACGGERGAASPSDGEYAKSGPAARTRIEVPRARERAGQTRRPRGCPRERTSLGTTRPRALWCIRWWAGMFETVKLGGGWGLLVRGAGAFERR